MRTTQSIIEFDIVSAVGRTLERYLDRTLEDERPVPARDTKAALIRVEDLQHGRDDVLVGQLGLTVLLWRVELRTDLPEAVPPASGAHRLRPAPLDLHFLVMAQADTAEHQHRILEVAVRALERLPLLPADMLHSPRTATSARDVDESARPPSNRVEIHPESMSNEELVRIWSTLPGGYRLSLPYVVRVARYATP